MQNTLMQEIQGWKDAKRHLMTSKRHLMTMLNHILSATEELSRDHFDLGDDFSIISGLNDLADELTDINGAIKIIRATMKRKLDRLEKEVKNV